MRNLLKNTFTSLALATVLVGTASANAMNSYQGDRLHSTPDETDTNQSYLYRAPAGQILSGGQSGVDRSQSTSVEGDDANKPWLDSSPEGQVVSPDSGSDRTQSAVVDPSEANKPWLDRSPLGVVVNPGSDSEAAETD